MIDPFSLYIDLQIRSALTQFQEFDEESLECLEPEVAVNDN